MHDLATLKVINQLAVERYKTATETETTRHCSYARGPAGGVVLHSAKQRSTAFLTATKARDFLVSWFATNSATKRDRLVESYF